MMALNSLTSNCLAATISSSFFLPNIFYEALLIFFPHFWPIYLFQTSISLILSPSVAWLCMFLLKSLPVHLTDCVYLDFLTVDPCIFVAYSYSSAFPIEHTCNYVPVRSMMSWMSQHTVNAPTLGKLLSNCPKWALKTMKCIRYSV